VLSSHILPEVQDICERVVIINKGRIVAQDMLENLTHGMSENAHVTVRVQGDEKQVQRLLREIPGVTYVESLGVKEPGSCDYMVEASELKDIRRPMFAELAKVGCPIMMLKPTEFTLEDIFMRITAEKEDLI
jgi:ABC-2 type transport system ATP-binding protein